MPPPFSGLAIAPDTAPMEAKLASEIPGGAGWQFEPKWDGFRCLAFRDGDAAELMSKSGKPLGRYFPEVLAALRALDETRFVLDGELVLPLGGVLSFAALQLRLHPAASRIEKLSRETPAQLMLFDCLQLGDEVLLDEPLSVRIGATSIAVIDDRAQHGIALNAHTAGNAPAADPDRATADKEA